MTRLPAPAPGTASVALREGAVVFEPRGAEIHVLNGPAAVVWAACCDGTTLPALLDELVEATALERAELAGQVEACLADLEGNGLVVAHLAGAAPRPATPWVEAEPAGAGPHRVRLAVLDEVVEVCDTDAAAVDDARQRCAALVTVAPPTLWLSVHEEPDGRVRLVGPRAGSRYHADRAALRSALVSELNVATVRWAGGLALHAGGVRHPGGTVVGLLGESGAGKSTLVGALVRAGWGYLTDEALAIRPDLGVVAYPKPIALDGTGLGLLGLAAEPGDVPATALRAGAAPVGDAGKVDALVLLDRHGDPRGRHALDDVDPGEVLTSLAPCSLNLHAAGSSGLAALVAAADGARCLRLTYADLGRAVDLLARIGGRAE